MTELPGRFIEDVPYAGLIERLSQISAVAHVVAEAPEGFDAGSLANMIVQIGELATEAVFLPAPPRQRPYNPFGK